MSKTNERPTYVVANSKTGQYGHSKYPHKFAMKRGWVDYEYWLKPEEEQS